MRVEMKLERQIPKRRKRTIFVALLESDAVVLNNNIKITKGNRKIMTDLSVRLIA
jgi:hypothetical protein